MQKKKLLKRIQLTCTALVESVNTCDDDRGRKTYRSCQKHESLSLHDLFAWPFVRHFMYNKPKVKSMHSSAHIQHHTKHLCYLSHTQSTTEIHSNVF
jgi:hypothetical protein